MNPKRLLSVLPLLLGLLGLPSCRRGTTEPRPAVQSPQRLAEGAPLADPAAASTVRQGGDWCRLRHDQLDWRLCNLHQHRPAEHGDFAGGTGEALPPCAAGGEDGPGDWVEIHWVFVRGASPATCAELRERALDEHASRLGADCPPPFLVRAAWARVTPEGDLAPATDPLPDAERYVEYDGSSTGGSDGKFPVHWKINRGCLETSEEALAGVPRDPTRPLQSPPLSGQPRTTMGN